MLLIKCLTNWSFILLLFCPLTTANDYWPKGSYGLPKPKAGCPGANGFQWSEGWLLQDTVRESGHARSPTLHLQADLSKNIKRYFCMKTSNSNGIDGGDWPKGKYCIYRKGGKCPKKMSVGNVHWDDEDFWNVNQQSGQTPDGVYNHNTRIFYCCHTKGLKENPISLPTNRPFFLMAYGSSTCQQVKWALASPEWLTFDTEEESDVSGKYPYGASRDNPTIHYCYYTSCNYTYSTPTGSFQSPNHPNHYPNGQWCSWRIHVANNQIIKLQFTSFDLERLINTDQVLVYDGANETSAQLGTFYGRNLPPSDGIQSSSSRMLVIFKSDGLSNKFTGFKASYSAVPKPTTLEPRPTTSVPRPTTSVPRPTTSVPRPTTQLPRATERFNSYTSTSLLTSHTQTSVTSTLGEVVAVTVAPSPSSQTMNKSYSYNTTTTEKTENTPTWPATDKQTETPEESSEVYKGRLQSNDDASRTAVSVVLPLLFIVVIIAILAGFIRNKRKRTQKKCAEHTTSLTNIDRPRPVINPVYATIEETRTHQSFSSGKKMKCSDNPLYEGGCLDKVQLNPTYERSAVNNHYETIPVV